MPKKKVVRHTIDLHNNKDIPHHMDHPAGGRVIHVTSKNWGFVDIYIEHMEEEQESQHRIFQFYRTGDVIPEDAFYTDTVVMRKVGFDNLLTEVYHLYERVS